MIFSTIQNPIMVKGLRCCHPVIWNSYIVFWSENELIVNLVSTLIYDQKSWNKILCFSTDQFKRFLNKWILTFANVFIGFLEKQSKFLSIFNLIIKYLCIITLLVAPRNGESLDNKTKVKTPKDQRSVAKLTGSFLTTSGETNSGVPWIIRTSLPLVWKLFKSHKTKKRKNKLLPDSKIFENPKSIS